MSQQDAQAKSITGRLSYKRYIFLQVLYHVCLFGSFFMSIQEGFSNEIPSANTITWGVWLFIAAVSFGIISMLFLGVLRKILEVVSAFLLTGVAGIFGSISALGFIFTSVGAWPFSLALKFFIIFGLSYGVGFLLIQGQYYRKLKK